MCYDRVFGWFEQMESLWTGCSGGWAQEAQVAGGMEMKKGGGLAAALRCSAPGGSLVSLGSVDRVTMCQLPSLTSTPGREGREGRGGGAGAGRASQDDR